LVQRALRLSARSKEIRVGQPAGTEDRAWTLGRLLEWTARYLVEKGAEFPRLDTEVLLAHILDCRRIDIYTRWEEEASGDVRTRFRDLVRRRVEGCPVAYLVGRKEFFSLAFEVSPAVLIPRPESEFVVLECLRLAASMSEPRILDIGTGSGNLAVAIAHQHRGARITAVDLSPKSLEIAARNAAHHGTADRIHLLAGDLFAPFSTEERFDFILSNPPYIPTDEIKNLACGVRDYEPHLALDGGPDGFAVFDRLVCGAPGRLCPGGYLIVEIGAPQHELARKRIESAGVYELADTIFDGSRHPRVLQARLKASTN
jgi:release factor glutamine methyltransferase